jgi:hypothetical protein
MDLSREKHHPSESFPATCHLHATPTREEGIERLRNRHWRADNARSLPPDHAEGPEHAMAGM